MTEKEIVEYLKNNRTKGVAFGFMPEEVQLWVRELGHIRQCIRFEAEEWKTLFTTNIWDKCDYSQILALPEDFELEEKSEGGWVEFDITDKGLFFLEYTDRGGSNVSHRFYWHQWSQFLEYCDLDELKYTVFGGWQYKDCDAWFLTPQIAMQGHFYNLCTKDDDPKPAIPTKIRFWREAR